MRIAFVLTLAALTTGCTTIDLDRTWTKPEVGVQQMSWDEWQCRREANETPKTPDVFIGGAADAARIAIETEERDLALDRCMQARGYVPSRPGGWKSVLSGLLYSFD